MAKSAAGGCGCSALRRWDDSFAALQVRNLATPPFAFYPTIKLTPPLFAPLPSYGNGQSFGNDGGARGGTIPSSKPVASTQQTAGGSVGVSFGASFSSGGGGILKALKAGSSGIIPNKALKVGRWRRRSPPSISADSVGALDGRPQRTAEGRRSYCPPLDCPCCLFGPPQVRCPLQERVDIFISQNI